MFFPVGYRYIFVGWTGKRMKGVTLGLGLSSEIWISWEVLLEFLFGGLILTINYLCPLGKRTKSRANWMFGWVAELFRGFGIVISDSVGLGGSLGICISDMEGGTNSPFCSIVVFSVPNLITPITTLQRCRGQIETNSIAEINYSWERRGEAGTHKLGALQHSMIHINWDPIWAGDKKMGPEGKH